MKPGVKKAKELIKQNRKTQAPFLDLGNLGLRDGDIPEELWGCGWLEHLNLGDFYKVEGEEELVQSPNGEGKNQFSKIPEELSRLEKLHSLELDEIGVSDISGLENLTTLRYLNIRYNKQIENIEVLQHLTQLKELNLSYNQIENIEVLQHLTQLKELNLSYNQIENIEVLQHLTQLKELNLSYNQIENIEVLQHLTQLKELNLSDNPQIQDFEVLQHLTQLKELNLSDNPQIQDFEVLQHLTQLKELNLSDNPQIQDFEVLQHLTQLKELNLSDNQIENIEVLQHLTQLNTLNLSDNQIENIEVLQHLTQLKELNLSSNPQIQDFEVLQHLTQLKELNLSDNPQIQDFEVLQHLTQLNTLNLSDNPQIQDFEVLQHLTQLNTLDLSSNQIENIEVLQHLTQLNTLNLRYNQIENIEVLQHLTQLNTLNLSDNQIENIEVLQHLTQLNTLNLRYNQIENIEVLQHLTQLNTLNLRYNQIENIEVLQHLTQLNTLNLRYNQIENIEVLQHLTQLNTLNLRYNQIENIEVLQHLTQLKELDLSYNKIENIEVLQHLTQLKELNLSDNQISQAQQISPLFTISTLYHLDVSKNPFINTPPEFFNQGNCLPDIRHWWVDLQREGIPTYEAKMIIVGNGRVGKTSILKALFHFGDFDPDEDSTHGIKLFEKEIILDGYENSIKLQIWDFGGQDIYHATHQLFMQSRCIYLVVWDVDTEEMPGEFEEKIKKKTVVFRNFSLGYWLGNVRALSPLSQLYVICNKADTGIENIPKDAAKLHQAFKIKSFLTVSAKTGFGFEELRIKLKRGLAEMPIVGMQMPASWMRIRAKLKKQRKKHKIFPWSKYQKYCEREELGEGSQKSLLRYLHNTGFLFWHSEHLKDQIILDQKWALEAIYRLYDRNDWYPTFKNKGLHDYRSLKNAWRGYKEEHIKVFQSIMQSCDLCVIVNEDKKDPIYLIPEFLPDYEPPSVNEVWKSRLEKAYWLKFEHQYFHAGFIQTFITRTAKLADRYDLMWRTGILINVENTFALVRAYPSSNQVIVEIKGMAPGEVMHRLIEEIKKIQTLVETYPFQVSLDGLDWIELEHLNRKTNLPNDMVATIGGNAVPVDELLPLLRRTKDPLQEKAKEKELAKANQASIPAEEQDLGLSGLANQRGGRHLTIPAAPLTVDDRVLLLKQKKKELNALLLKDPEEAIQALGEILAEDKERMKTLTLISSRYHRTMQTKMRDVQEPEKIETQKNKILEDILDVIYGLKVDDFS